MHLFVDLAKIGFVRALNVSARRAWPIVISCGWTIKAGERYGIGNWRLVHEYVVREVDEALLGMDRGSAGELRSDSMKARSCGRSSGSHMQSGRFYHLDG